MNNTLRAVNAIILLCLISVFPTLPAFSAPLSTIAENEPIYAISKETINAPPEAVWKVLTDYNHATSIFPYLTKSLIIEDRGTTKLLDQTIRPSPFWGPLECILELKETSPALLEFHRLSGAFRENRGYWKLEPLDGGKRTLVSFAKYIDIGMPIPQVVVRHLLAADMPPVLQALKTRSETNCQLAHTLTPSNQD